MESEIIKPKIRLSELKYLFSEIEGVAGDGYWNTAIIHEKCDDSHTFNLFQKNHFNYKRWKIKIQPLVGVLGHCK